MKRRAMLTLLALASLVLAMVGTSVAVATEDDNGSVTPEACELPDTDAWRLNLHLQGPGEFDILIQGNPILDLDNNPPNLVDGETLLLEFTYLGDDEVDVTVAIDGTQVLDEVYTSEDAVDCTAEPDPEPEPGTQNISAKALDDHECDESEWHFVITDMHNVDAPESIEVTWGNGETETVELDRVTGNVAHYSTTSHLDSFVESATAEIDEEWDGQFNLSHGPCEQEEKPEPKKRTVTLNKVFIGSDFFHFGDDRPTDTGFTVVVEDSEGNTVATLNDDNLTVTFEAKVGEKFTVTEVETGDGWEQRTMGIAEVPCLDEGAEIEVQPKDAGEQVRGNIHQVCNEKVVEEEPKEEEPKEEEPKEEEPKEEEPKEEKPKQPDEKKEPKEEPKKVEEVKEKKERPRAEGDIVSAGADIAALTAFALGVLLLLGSGIFALRLRRR